MIAVRELSSDVYVCGVHAYTRTGLLASSRGAARVTIEPSSHETQYPQLYPLQDPDDVIAREELQVPNRDIFM